MQEIDSLSRLMTPKGLVQSYPNLGFTERGLRNLLNKRHENGLDECVVHRSEHRLLIDVDKFDAWIRNNDG